MNFIWSIFMIASIFLGALSGKGKQMTEALLSSGSDAIVLCLSLAGAYALWCGLMNVMEKSGLSGAIARLLKPVMRLFPGLRGHAQVESAVAANLAANMLGLGNAATPAGIEAMKGMRELSGDASRASDAMCMFLVVNASSIQLLPTTVISLRAAAGAAQPFDIVWPTLVATACSTVAAVLLMKLTIWGEKRAYGDASGGRAAAHGSARHPIRGFARRRGV